MALMLVYTLSPVAARCDVAIWIERAPPKLNLADSPSRGHGLPFETEPERELSGLEDIVAFCDVSRMLISEQLISSQLSRKLPKSHISPA